MPVAKVKLGEYADIDAAEGFSDYTGPVPPSGAYRCRVKWMKLTTNKSKDPMFKVLLEITEPKGSEKAKYNGYAIWHNANITSVGAPYLNAMLDAFGLPRAGKILLSDEKEDRVVKIGGKPVDGIAVLVTAKKKAKFGTDPEDEEWTMDAKGFAPAGKVSTAKPPADEDDGDADTDDAGDDSTEEADADDSTEDDGDEDAF